MEKPCICKVFSLYNIYKLIIMSTIVKLAVNGNRNKYAPEGVGIEKRIVPTKEVIREAYRPMSDYRMRLVGFFEGVRYIEDSYSTNANSAWWALETTPGPLVWIVGGMDRGNNDYSPLVVPVKKKVSHIVILGDNKGNEKIHRAFERFVPITPNCLSMDEAVVRAREFATPGSSILLAPACASFDLFKDKEHRAAEFRASVGRYACKIPTEW